MSFTLTTFGALALPTGSPELPVGSAPSVEMITRMPGGMFWDGNQTDQARPDLPWDLPYHCRHLIADESGYNNVVEQWWAVRGQRAALTRRLTVPYSGFDVDQWCWARLKRIETSREAKMSKLLPMVFVFQILSPWYGTLHDDTYGLTTPPSIAAYLQSIFISNAGTRPITNLRLTITAGAAHNLAAVKIGCRDTAGVTLTEVLYSGTIFGESFAVIDGGAWSVLNAVTNDYAHLALTANHTKDYWFWIPASDSAYLDITRTGTGAGSLAGDTLGVTWYDEYE